MTTSRIEQAFKRLVDVTKDKYRKKAFSNVVNYCKSLQEEGRTEANLKDFSGQMGIGPGCLERIQEFLATGNLAELVPLEEKNDTHLLKIFTGIIGVGPVTAQKFISAGYSSIAQLREAVATSKLQLTANQSVSLRHYEDLQERIPRIEIDRIKDKLRDYADRFDLVLKIAGSYRRAAETSGDIDCLVSSQKDSLRNDARDFVYYLKRKGIVTDILSDGPIKYSCLIITDKAINKHRQLDLQTILPAQWASALLYFTGSKEHNIKIRQAALDQGFQTLNEYGLFRLDSNNTAVQVETKSEEDIFRLVKLPYLKPSQR